MIAVCALALVLAVPASRSQSPAAAPAVTPLTAATFAASVRALDGQAGLWIGAVSEKAGENGDALQFGGMVVQVGGGGGAAQYAGNIEVVRTEKKELLIASLHELPEIAVYDDGTRRLVRTTVDEQPVSANQLANDLVRLLDFAALASQVEKAAKFDAGTPATDGSRLVTCELSPRALHSTGGPLEARVLAVIARFDVDAAGKLLALEFSVTRTDPLAGMRQRALAGGANGGAITLGESDLDEAHVAGPTATYQLRPKPDAPSAHAREALASLRKLCPPK